MIIINADDWGRSREETGAILFYYKEGRITSTSAMVFMEDSKRAADLAKACDIDVGLHLNLSQRYTGQLPFSTIGEEQDSIVRFMTMSKYAMLVYHPFLRKQFRNAFQAQWDEFLRLYGKPPSHVDGHHHRHLCSNMLLDGIIPRGERVRRNFSFLPGEKGILNRTYRWLADERLSRRYRLTGFFFSLLRCLETKTLDRACQLAETAVVELMVHPLNAPEHAYLKSNEHLQRLSKLVTGNFAKL